MWGLLVLSLGAWAPVAQGAPTGQVERASALIQADLAAAASTAIKNDAGHAAAVKKTAAVIQDTLQTALERIKARRAPDALEYETTVKLSKEASVKVRSPSARARIAFYPIAANPTTYGHIAVMLRLMAEKNVDHVVVVPAGMDNRKPDVTASQKFRTTALRHTLKSLGLDSMISVSTISQNTSRHGEESLMKWLALNHGKKINAQYVAGGDHGFYLKNGKPDTLGKLSVNREQGPLGRLASKLEARTATPSRLAALLRRIEAKMGRGFDARDHSIEAVIVARDEDGGLIKRLPEPPPHLSPVKGSVMTALKFDSSATKIRNALKGKEARNLILLPHTSHQIIDKAAAQGLSPYHAKTEKVSRLGRALKSAKARLGALRRGAASILRRR